MELVDVVLDSNEEIKRIGEVSSVIGQLGENFILIYKNW